MKTTIKTGIAFVVSCLLGILLFPPTAFAHKVMIAAWVEGNTVYTESYFGGGSRPKNAKIEVFDMQGNKLLEGKTNDVGEFYFTPPKKLAMKILLNAGMGHQASCTVQKEDFEDVEDFSDPTAASTTVSNVVPSVAKKESSAYPDEQVIRQIVASEMDKQMNKLMHQLNRPAVSDQNPQIKDILGGIGYIIGLVGLGAFIHFRMKVKELETGTC